MKKGNQLILTGKIRKPGVFQFSQQQQEFHYVLEFFPWHSSIKLAILENNY